MKRTLVILMLLWAPALAVAGPPFLDMENNTGGIGNLKALKVGDIVTIIIVEQASGDTGAKTQTNSKSEIGGGPGLGMLNMITDWSLDSENKFQGDGKSSRSGDLNARISTRVLEVLPNGNYRLEGERVVEINGERQHLQLSGIIRPEDLKADNTIASTFVADAYIVYDGHGPVADAHSPGILSRIANFIF